MTPDVIPVTAGRPSGDTAPPPGIFPSFLPHSAASPSYPSRKPGPGSQARFRQDSVWRGLASRIFHPSGHTSGSKGEEGQHPKQRQKSANIKPTCKRD